MRDQSLKYQQKDFKVCVFDGTAKNSMCMNTDTKQKFTETKAMLGKKLNIVMKKRSIIANYLEKVMELYDISKTKKLVAEKPAEK